MNLRPHSLSLSRLKFKLGGAAFALSLGLASCGSGNSTTPTTTPVGTYTLTVTLTGVNGSHSLTLTPAGGSPKIYTVYSGAVISGLKGMYTVTAETANKVTPAPQTVDLSSANQTLTIAY